MFFRAALLISSSIGDAIASDCGPANFFKMVDNFREVQTVDLAYRTVFRTSAASATCSACGSEENLSSTCDKAEPATEVFRPYDTTTNGHFSYSDQKHWDAFRVRPLYSGFSASAWKRWNAPGV